MGALPLHMILKTTQLSATQKRETFLAVFKWHFIAYRARWQIFGCKYLGAPKHIMECHSGAAMIKIPHVTYYVIFSLFCRISTLHFSTQKVYSPV